MRGCARFTIPSNDVNKSTCAPLAELMSMQSMFDAGVENVGRNRSLGQSSPAPHAPTATLNHRAEANMLFMPRKENWFWVRLSMGRAHHASVPRPCQPLGDF